MSEVQTNLKGNIGKIASQFSGNKISKKMPVDKLSVRGCQVTIWENESNGNVFRQLTLGKYYKDENNEYKTGHSFSINDIPNLVVALEEMYRREVLKN